MMYDSPSSTERSAFLQISCTAFSRPFGPSEMRNVMGMTSVEKPRYFRFFRRSISRLVMIGCLTFTMRQLSGVGDRMSLCTDPTYPVTDMTSSSLMGSMAGFVTGAKDCLK